MKILVTGVTGQLGYEVCKELADRKIEYCGTDSKELDVTNAAAVSAYLQHCHPDAVIHCAAYTAVDQAEKEKKRCFEVNEGGTRNITAACKAIDAKLIYISTDYVFPGNGDNCYETNDSTKPQNVYGESKLAGEKIIQSTLTKYFIVRTSWMFGQNSDNFVQKLLRRAQINQHLSMVSDQFGSPTYAADLARLLCDMVQTEKYGVYHATNEGICSRLELADEIFRQTWNNVEIIPVASENYPMPANRPLNSRLSKKSLDDAGFVRLPAWQDALWRYLRTDSQQKKVLVTGGNGYIGKHVVRTLLDAGYHVMVAASQYEDTDPRAVRCTESIFSGAEDIYRRVGSPDVCIHLAWKDGFIHNSPAHMANLSDHITFCNHMMKGGLPILSCMGTMHEVGYWEGAIDENTPCNPQTQYGIAKNAMRQSLLLSAKDTDCTLHWLRLFYIVSDNVNGSNIFAKIMSAAQAGRTKFPFTTGKNLYDFMKIEELARLIVLASLQTEVTETTNICTGKPIPLSSCIEGFIREHKLPIELSYGEFPDRPYDSPGVWGDASKIQRIVKNSALAQSVAR